MAVTERTMRQRLDAYVDLRKELRMQAMRLDQMRQTIGDIRSPKYEPGKASSGPDDGVARDVIALENLEHRVAELIGHEESEHDDLERMICRVTNAQQRALLRLRYFDLKDWADIAFAFFGDRADFLTEEHDYVAKCYRLHSRAVSSLVAVHRRMFA